ncbi:protein of unknown function [Candidatus Promineifilum breve]|mgnify:FL=1|uniref:Uncharacterized protein n=1 Tax=Candidatus Promineifilum breve TaxID=1806508 RepID=A0A160T702_9CHLR|nr:hypothetical protein [Candidatus Promineifilum breve]CUS05369.2 protein of unknown function [Candidatus Promineifilum breve]
MHLHILLTADHAYIDNATGKLYVLGAFNNIGVPQFPWRYEKMALVVRIGSDVTDRTNEQILTAILMDEDSQEILKLSIPFTLGIAHDGTRPHFDMIGELAGVIFPQPGKYVFRIYVGDDELGSTPIDITALKR